MVFCQDCGNENSVGANFCESCGAKLLNTTLTGQDANKQKTQEGLKMKSIICENCGKIYKGEICPKCGTHKEESIEEIKRRKEETKQKYQNKKDKRDKINEDYGFTNDEIVMMYHDEAKKADRVYNAFVTYGISRLDKVNGRFLASQLIKLDVLSQQNNRIIQQNDEIIGLLKEIVENTR